MKKREELSSSPVTVMSIQWLRVDVVPVKLALQQYCPSSDLSMLVSLNTLVNLFTTAPEGEVCMDPSDELTDWLLCSHDTTRALWSGPIGLLRVIVQLNCLLGTASTTSRSWFSICTTDRNVSVCRSEMKH